VKIGFLIRALERGGAELQMTMLACELVKLGHKVVVMTYYEGGDLKSVLKRNGVQVICLGKETRWQLIGLLMSLIRAVQKNNIVVLYSFLTTANVVALLVKPFLRNTKIVLGIRSSDLDFKKYDWLTKISLLLEATLMRFADRVIFNSFYSQRNYRRWLPLERSFVVHNAVDTKYFDLPRSSGSKMRKVWGIGPSTKVIGMVARIDPMKDYKTFLTAAQLAIQKRPDLFFVCVTKGEDKQEQKYRKFCEELGIADRFVWCGPFIDMPDIYTSFDILTLSSSFGEGFPNVLAEAMACGVPCVATDIGDASLIISDQGIIVPPQRADKLANAWEHLLNSALTDERRVVIRKQIVENYSISSMVGTTEAIICDGQTKCAG
jgi:glycosyltransferase involved in cell wall biosynthesis